MAGLTDLAGDERTARRALSMLVEPNDPVTGRILTQLGAMETLWLAEHDSAVVGLSAVDAHVWRGHFDVPGVKDVASRLDQVQRSGVRALIPGDADWPAALHDLGEGALYVSWARGASFFLVRPVQDFITITGRAHPLPTATILPANSPLRRLRTNGWSSPVARMGSTVPRTKLPSRQVGTLSRFSLTALTVLTLLAIATYSNAWPMPGFLSARCRPVPFRPGSVHRSRAADGGARVYGDHRRGRKPVEPLNKTCPPWLMVRIVPNSWLVNACSPVAMTGSFLRSGNDVTAQGAHYGFH